MSSTATAHRRAAPEAPPSLLIQIGLMLALAGVFFFLLLLIVGAGYDVYHSGKIYPGIWMAGTDLSGLTQEQAASVMAEQVTFPSTGKIALRSGQDVWIVQPGELGLTLDAQASAQTAYNLGRQGNPLRRLFEKFSAWYSGRSLPPQLVYDERQARVYLSQVAAQIDQPTVEASLNIQGANVQAVQGQVGRRLDIAATLAPLAELLPGLTDSLVPLVVVEAPPEILDASQAAEQAKGILEAPITLQVPDAQEGDPGPWTLEPAQVAELLTIEKIAAPEGARYQLGLRNGPLRRFLDEQSEKLARNPANARFVFNDETSQLEVLQPSVTGRSLNVAASIEAISDKVLQGEHSIPLSFDYTEPEVSSESTAEQLGISELVSSHTSYFRGSSAERIQNISAAAASFHGLLVPPGAVFSMAESMSDVSLDNGFAEALIIVGGRTVKGVGGGVCQVSTTLFRTAFLGGFPIVERYPHAYRVGYYEQTANGWDANLAGLDATVFVPQVDFKFKNDTPYWLLMETYVNEKAGRITWKFYSTSDGRQVSWDSSGPQNIVDPPKALYEENPDLAPGEIKQVDWAAEGADVIVTRVVSRDGEVLFSDEIITHYQPWRDIYQYGPGTDINRD